jgi:hypothetical protein
MNMQPSRKGDFLHRVFQELERRSVRQSCHFPKTFFNNSVVCITG